MMTSIAARLVAKPPTAVPMPSPFIRFLLSPTIEDVRPETVVSCMATAETAMARVSVARA